MNQGEDKQLKSIRFSKQVEFCSSCGIISKQHSRSVGTQKNSRKQLVDYSMGLITASRHGISSKSITEDVLVDVCEWWQPPIRRIPPLLWTRVREDLGQYVMEQESCGVIVYRWYHRQFLECAESLFQATTSKTTQSTLLFLWRKLEHSQHTFIQIERRNWREGWSNGISPTIGICWRNIQLGYWSITNNRKDHWLITYSSPYFIMKEDTTFQHPMDSSFWSSKWIKKFSVSFVLGLSNALKNIIWNWNDHIRWISSSVKIKNN